MIKKITSGFVEQEFDDNGKAVSQEFYQGENVDYENLFGEPVDCPANEQDFVPDMIQPIQDLLEEPIPANLLVASNINVTVEVDIDMVISFDLESLMDYFEELIVGNAGALSDISFDMVGCNPLTHVVYFKVDAVAENVTGAY